MQDLQTEFLTLLNDYNGNPHRVIELLDMFIDQQGGLLTSGIEEIGNSPIAQNPENKEVLRDFFLNIFTIERIFKSKEAAFKAKDILSAGLPYLAVIPVIQAITSSNLPENDMEALD